MAADADGATLIVLHSRAASKTTALRLTPQETGPDGADAIPSHTKVEVGQRPQVHMSHRLGTHGIHMTGFW